MHNRLASRLTRAKGEHGFTLIELLVVIVILGILLAVAVPAYTTYRTRAGNAAAQANVRAALPSVEAYAADSANGYVGLDTAALRAIDPAVAVTVLGASTATSYCLRSIDQPYHYKRGPDSPITTTACTGP